MSRRTREEDGAEELRWVRCARCGRWVLEEDAAVVPDSPRQWLGWMIVCCSCAAAGIDEGSR